MKAGDIVWTEAFGHISKWVVLRKDGHGFIRLYQIQENGRDVDEDRFFNAQEGGFFATEAEAIQEAIKWENTEFENRTYNHNAFLEKMSKKLGQTEEQK